MTKKIRLPDPPAADAVPTTAITLETVATEIGVPVEVVSRAIHNQRLPLLSTGNGRGRRYFLAAADVPRIAAAVRMEAEAAAARAARRHRAVPKSARPLIDVVQSDTSGLTTLDALSILHAADAKLNALAVKVNEILALLAPLAR